MVASQSLYKDRTIYMTVLLMVLSFWIYYFLNAYLSNILPAEQYGDTVLIMRLLSFSVPFMVFGIQQSGVKFLTAYLDARENSSFLGFLNWTKQIFIRGVAVLSIIAIVLWFTHSEEFRHFVYSIWIIPVISFLFLERMMLQVLGKTVLAYGLSNVVVYAIVFCLIFALHLANIDFINVYSVVFSFGLSCVLVSLALFVILHKHFPHEVFKVEKTLLDRSEWFWTSSFMMQTSVLYLGLLTIDLLMLKVLGQPGDVIAQFAVFLSVTNIFMIFREAIVVIIQPKISYLLHKKNKKGLSKLINQASLINFGLLFILATCMVKYPDFWLYLFHHTYAGEENLLRLMVVLLAVAYTFSLGIQFLMFANRHKLVAILNYLQIFSIVILDCIFVPQYGLLGAIMVLGICKISFNVIATILYIREMRMLKES